MPDIEQLGYERTIVYKMLREIRTLCKNHKNNELERCLEQLKLPEPYETSIKRTCWDDGIEIVFTKLENDRMILTAQPAEYSRNFEQPDADSITVFNPNERSDSTTQAKTPEIRTVQTVNKRKKSWWFSK